jgi:riboflavin transporter
LKGEKMKNNQRLLTLISMMIALSFLFMYFEFPMPFLFPAYLKIDPSDIPALFTGLFIGPLPAIVIELGKNILHALFNMKEANFSGEIANFSYGVAFILPVSIFAQIMKSKIKTYSSKQFMIRFIPFFVLGIILSSIVMGFVNYYITFPLYGMTDHVVKITGIISGTPFNIFKGVLITIVTYLLYPSLKKIFDRYFNRVTMKVK